MQICSADFMKNIVIDRGTEAKDTQAYAFELPVILPLKITRFQVLEQQA